MDNLFDKKYVRFLWDEDLKGKDCIVADTIPKLISAVNEGYYSSYYRYHGGLIERSEDPDKPFELNGECFTFAYYCQDYTTNDRYKI